MGDLDTKYLDWYNSLWNTQELPGFIETNNSITNLTDRNTGINLTNAAKRNLAYVNSPHGVRQGDFDYFINNQKQGTNFKDLSFDDIINIYNERVISLDSIFNPNVDKYSWFSKAAYDPVKLKDPSGIINYDKNKFNAAYHNATFQIGYNSRSNNKTKDPWNIGYDSNPNIESWGGSSTWERRPVKYQDSFKNLIDAGKFKEAWDRVYDFGNFGKIYVENDGTIQKLPLDWKNLLENHIINQVPINKPEREIKKIPPLDVSNLKPLDIVQDDGDKLDQKTPGKSGNKGFWSKIGSILTPGLFSSLRVITDNFTNLRNTEELNSHLRPPLQTPWQAHKAVYGDYIAKRLGEQQSARLESMASRPMTSDASLQLAGQLEAVDKGAQQVLAGQQRDAAQYYKTRDEAINQAIQNLQVRTQVANTDRQLQSQYEAMKAHNIFNAKQKNRQNRDRWWALWEDRALAEYDYQRKLKQLEREHQLAQKLGLQEKMDSVSDLLGVDDTELNVAISALGDTTDPTARQQLLQRIKELTKRRQLQIYRNMGDRLGIQWNKQWSDLFKANEIGKQLAKNGGVLRKLQQGGGLPMVEWTPLMGRPYQQYLSLQMTNSPLLNYYSGASGYSSSSRSSSSSSSSDKEENSIIKNIVETLKGVNGLNSDVNKLASELSNFLDVQRYLPDDLSTDQLYSQYLNALVRLNSVKRSAETFKNAEQAVTQNGGLHEYAVDSNGNVYVGTTVNGEPKVINVTLDDYRENAREKGYRLLTNNDLLYLRDNLFAFDDTISSTVSNGIGMEQVGKYIKDFVGNLGTSKEARDRLIYHFGEQALIGFNTLKELQKKHLTNEETTALMAKGIDGLWELHTIDSNQEKQLSAAVSAISETMPENMKTLIKLKTGSSVSDFVEKMLISGTSDTTEFTIKDITALDEAGKLKSSTKTGSGGSSSGEEATSRFLEDFQKGWGGSDGFIILNPGDQLELVIPTKDYNPIEAAAPSSLTEALVNSKLWGIGKDNNTKIYFGDQKIPTEKLNEIVYTGQGFSRVILPINSDGSPRFAIFSEIQKILKDLNININDLYEGNLNEEKTNQLIEKLNSKGLSNLVSNNDIDLTKFGVFAITKGLASSKVGISDQNKFVHRQENPDYDWYSSVLSTKGLDNKVQKYELDVPNIWNPTEWDIFGGKFHTNIYEGTIYIPISLNPEMATIAEGNKEKPSTAKQREKENQTWKTIYTYKNAPSIDVLQQ